jgi:flagellar hook-associated protein 1 FlgK
MQNQANHAYVQEALDLISGSIAILTGAALAPKTGYMRTKRPDNRGFRTQAGASESGGIVMGLTSTFSIAERGLQIAQAAMEVISHNIANVNTEGYSRQTLNLSTAYPWDSMYGPMGTGVQGDNITRAYDRFIVQNLIDKNSLLAKYEAEKTAIDSIEAVFNESNGNGINEALSDFWNAWQELANNPEGNPERLNLLEKAQTLASHIEITRQDLDNIRADINTRIEEGIDYVNELVKSIASLNDQIVAAEAGENQHANDLRDQRDQYIQELGSLMDIDYYEDPRNGAVAVLTPKGTPLVMDNAYWQLQAEADANDNIQVLWTRNNGGTVNITENIETGNLGGWIEIRDDIMNEIYAQFEAFTEGLITEVNRVHTQGVGLAKYTDVTSTYDLSDNAANVLEFSGNDNDIVISALTPAWVRKTWAFEFWPEQLREASKSTLPLMRPPAPITSRSRYQSTRRDRSP